MELIWSRDEISAFATLFLEPCSTYMMYIQSRPKYSETKQRSTCPIHRKVFPQSDLVQAIEYLCTTSDRFKQTQDETKLMPLTSMALYGSINPRNVVKCNKEMVKFIIDIGFESLVDIGSKQKSNLHKFGIRKFITIDFDNKNVVVFKSFMKELRQKITVTAVIETRGGYHVVLHKDAIGVNGKFLYKELKAKWIDIDVISNDLFSPIPGTVQGGFPVKFLVLDEE
jgi:hypothetical protein